MGKNDKNHIIEISNNDIEMGRLILEYLIRIVRGELGNKVKGGKYYEEQDKDTA